MKTQRNCHHCGKGPVTGCTLWLNGIHARWHPKCFIAAKQKIMEKTFPPSKKKSSASKTRA